jgi:glycosyltransferase involved in cell wall biosynthesis
MARRKVLHVVEDLNIGGLARVVQCIVLGLDRERYDVAVWCLASGGVIFDELQRMGIPVEVLGLHSYHDPINVLTLARRMRCGGFHIIHTHGYYAGTFGRLAAVMARVPAVIHHVHTTYSNLKPRHRRVERILSSVTGHIICVAEAVRDNLSNVLRIPEGKTCVIYNASAVQPEKSSLAVVESTRTALGIRPGDTVITVVASLSDNKGQAVLLDAFRPVAAAHPGSKVVFVGDGPLRQALEGQARISGLASRVVFAGVLKDVSPVLRLTDVLVLPTTEREGLSVALVEGLSAGIPLIGSRLGGIPEVVEDKVNGILVKPGSAVELGSALERLLCSPEIRKRMGKAGRAIYDCKFTLSRMMAQIQALYDGEMKRRDHAA